MVVEEDYEDARQAFIDAGLSEDIHKP